MPGNLCEHCTAACCRYVALPIETPEDRSDFDDIRWYLIHENVSVFVEDDEWFISFATPCRHLLPDHRCGIYETRPQICRRYTTENCDYHSGDYGWEEHFTSPEHLDAYVAQHLGAKGGKRAGRSGQKPGRNGQKGGRNGQKSGSRNGQRSTSLKAQPGRRRKRLDAVRTDKAGMELPVLPRPRMEPAGDRP